jgi:hypothetical protein
MVPSSALTISTNSEHLMCGGYSLGEIVRLGSFEFVEDYFGGLSLSPRRSDLCIAFMGSTHSRTPSMRWAMIEDSAEEFHMASSGEGAPASLLLGASTRGSALSRHNHTMDGGRSNHMMMVPPWMVVPRQDTRLSYEQQHAHQEGQRAQTHAQQPSTE